jgi:hypothetical protein
MNSQYTLCLHYIKIEKERSLGREPDYVTPKCKDCIPENQSAIICHRYIDKKHLEDFLRFGLS